MMKEIKVIECNSVDEAEVEYFLLRSQNCWQVIKPLKVVFSWKRFRYVVRFTVKRVEPKYYEGYMGDIKNAITGIMAIMANRKALRIVRSKKPLYDSSLQQHFKSLK